MFSHQVGCFGGLFFILVFLKTEFCYLAHADLELKIVLPHPPSASIHHYNYVDFQDLARSNSKRFFLEIHCFALPHI